MGTVVRKRHAKGARTWVTQDGLLVVCRSSVDGVSKRGKPTSQAPETEFRSAYLNGCSLNHNVAQRHGPHVLLFSMSRASTHQVYERRRISLSVVVVSGC